MKYALIGTGNISSTFVDAISGIEGSEIVACVSRSGKSPAADPSIPSFTGLKEIDRNFDAVIIATPNGLHRPFTVEAAGMAKHILTEKPLDITIPAMDEIIEACRRSGVTLGVSYQRRTNPDNLAVKTLLDTGELGRVFAADLSCKFWRDASYYDSAPYRGTWAVDGGGPFIQQACHNIDLYQWLFGMPVEVKSTLGTLYHNIETEDHGAAVFRHENGMIGSIVASTLARPGLPARLEVHTEKGYFTTLDDRISHWEIDGVANPAAPVEEGEGAQANTAAVGDSSRHEAIIRDFEEAVSDGRSPLVSGESARKTTELILRIYESGRQEQGN